MATIINRRIQMLLEAVAVAEEELESGEITTKTIRVFADLIAKLKVIEAAAVIEGTPFKTATYLDAILRKPIIADYKKALGVLRKTNPEA